MEPVNRTSESLRSLVCAIAQLDIDRLLSSSG